MSCSGHQSARSIFSFKVLTAISSYPRFPDFTSLELVLCCPSSCWKTSRRVYKKEWKYFLKRNELLAVVTFIKPFQSYLTGDILSSDQITVRYSGCTISILLRGGLLGGYS